MSNFINPAPNARLTSKFGYRTINGKKEWHQGIDLAQTGTVPILAAADGVVREVWGEKVSSYGNVIFLQHTIKGKRMDTTYAHLKSISVKKGQKVKQGQVIGYMGNTGRSYGQHLHFEIHNGAWKSGQPNAVDPMKYISLDDMKTNKGGLTMEQYTELKKLIEAQNAKITALQKELAKKENIREEREVGDSFTESWKWANDNGILNGKSPQNNVTREQLSIIVKRVFDKLS